MNASANLTSTNSQKDDPMTIQPFQIDMAMIPVGEKTPGEGQTVLVRCLDRGEPFVATAVYAGVHRPLAPWRSIDGDALDDAGHVPTHWLPIVSSHRSS